MSRSRAPIWSPFVWASLWLALTAGFGLGGALFLAEAAHAPLGLWWPAAASAHGHIQVFGWAGLMVLGVGFHFLPRLRGATAPLGGGAAAVLALLVAGLLLRTVSQPLLAVTNHTAPGGMIWRAALAGSGFLEIAGASLALRVLARLLRSGPPLRERASLWTVLPFFLTAFGAFWLALGVNLLGILSATLTAGVLVPDWADRLTLQVAFYGFLVPVSVAMSARTFPIFFRTPLPRLRLLRGSLALLLTGLALRTGGELGHAGGVGGLGDLGVAAALGLFILALGVFAPRRPLPRQAVRPFADPAQWHVFTAYAWLGVTALLLVWNGLAALGLALPPIDPDAERHALGAGFVTLLILGVGARLLPGFAGRRVRRPALVWATLALGNAAALLRVGPLFPPVAVSPSLTSALLSLAGLADLAALAAFGLNVWGLGGARRSL